MILTRGCICLGGSLFFCAEAAAIPMIYTLPPRAISGCPAGHKDPCFFAGVEPGEYFSTCWIEMGNQPAGSAAGKRCALNLAGNGYPQFMTENKGAFVLAIEIAGELKHRNPIASNLEAIRRALAGY
jgi:hypothetical protein